MLGQLSGIVNSTLRERIDKSIVEKLITANIILDQVILLKENLKFTNELAEDLHKPVSKKIARRRVNVNGIDKIWAADLIDMQAFSKQNKGIKYLLTVIDVFYKFLWIFL